MRFYPSENWYHRAAVHDDDYDDDDDDDDDEEEEEEDDDDDDDDDEEEEDEEEEEDDVNLNDMKPFQSKRAPGARRLSPICNGFMTSSTVLLYIAYIHCSKFKYCIINNVAVYALKI